MVCISGFAATVYAFASPLFGDGFETRVTPRVSKCAVRRAASLAEVASGSPIDRGDSPHYAPTQFLAEYMRAAGYASIRYRSGFGAGGDNIALFNLGRRGCPRRNAQATPINSYDVFHLAMRRPVQTAASATRSLGSTGFVNASLMECHTTPSRSSSGTRPSYVRTERADDWIEQSTSLTSRHSSNSARLISEARLGRTSDIAVSGLVAT
jgi:hypothetical protein